MNCHRRRVVNALLAGCLTLLLSGCGYQLRGATTALPAGVSPVLIAGIETHSRMGRQLQRALTDAGATVTDSRDSARGVLRIIEHRSSLHVLSVDRDTRAQEYELRESIRFAFESLHDGRTVPAQQLNARRIFNRERSRATREEEEERSEMREDLFRRMVNRLQAQL